MPDNFWISSAQMDAEQKNAVEEIDENASFLIRGPAGSGKTNILLLRAKWLTLRRMTNFKIVSFTSSLRNFIESGCRQYGINPESAVTQMTLFKSILLEYGEKFEPSGDFEADRSLLSGKLLSLVEASRISHNYCETLLIDEAQDYTDTELLVFRGIARNLVLVSDSRQSIYKATHAHDLAERLVKGNVVTLTFHYRSGLKLCRVADAILGDSSAYAKIQPECKYPESVFPSSVTIDPAEDFGRQLDLILTRLPDQLRLYPEEHVGVLFPKSDQAAEFRARLQSDPALSEGGRIWTGTMHASKGWEFRAVHLGGCESLSRMGAVQKRLIYTALLRGKTSAHFYFSGHIPGYLEAALATLTPPVARPKLDDLF